MNELQKIDSLLSRLDQLNKLKFNLSDFDDVNKKLQSSIENFRENFKDKEINKLSTDDKETFINILSKIESLESQILPKANLVNSFSNYKI
ncbi:MAG: hypothetical protein ISQ83_04290 [Alphaproteobacteria bacterium]|nr:hypothetical protein [Alphaproteobacteria bacterium]